MTQQLPAAAELSRKPKVDHEALGSPFMRIPRFSIPAARDLLDLGFREIWQLQGRSPEALFQELCRRRPETPRDRLRFLRMAVYFSETPQPDPARLHPAVWAD